MSELARRAAARSSLGGGFAGAYVARLLGRRGATLVSPENFMLYTPILPEAASGTLEPRHVVVPLRQMCPHAELLLGRAPTSTRSARTVTVETRRASVRRRATSSSCRARRGRAHPADPRARRARRSASRTSPTRSSCAITFSGELEAAVAEPTEQAGGAT